MDVVFVPSAVVAFDIETRNAFKRTEGGRTYRNEDAELVMFSLATHSNKNHVHAAAWLACGEDGTLQLMHREGKYDLMRCEVSTEADLLNALDEMLGEIRRRNSKLVTYNGKKFDMPFVARRAVDLGVPLSFRDIVHFDLFEDGISKHIWTGSGSGKASLKHLARQWGCMPFDLGVKAKDVADMLADERKEIRDLAVLYCLNDSIATLLIYDKLEELIPAWYLHGKKY